MFRADEFVWLADWLLVLFGVLLVIRSNAPLFYFSLAHSACSFPQSAIDIRAPLRGFLMGAANTHAQGSCAPTLVYL